MALPAPLVRRYQVLVCKGPECGDKRGGDSVHAAFVAALAACPLQGNSAEIDRYSCFGRCQKGPNVLIREMRTGEATRMLMLMPTAAPAAFLYHGVRPADAQRIVSEHIASGRPIVLMTHRAPVPAYPLTS